MPNKASELKEILRRRHYAVRSATARKIIPKQYDYQLYPTSLAELLTITGPDNLKIIPIGDHDVSGDFWVIPYNHLRQFLTENNLTSGLDRYGKPRANRWRFHIEVYSHEFVIYPGERSRIECGTVKQFYAADLPATSN